MNNTPLFINNCHLNAIVVFAPLFSKFETPNLTFNGNFEARFLPLVNPVRMRGYYGF